MPSWQEVQKEILYLNSLNPFDMVRGKYLASLAETTGRNIICYYSGWLQKNCQGSISEEDMNAFMSVIHGLDKTKGLDLLLHTPGGDLTATEALLNYLKKMFQKDIRAIIPQISMSAGTVLACSCKEIIMGKQSSLGPIDPQFGGIPAQGIIEEFEEAIASIEKNPASIPVWQTLLAKYHPTFLGEAQKAIILSKEMCSSALKDNMFYSDTGKNKKVKKIVDWLSSHGKSKTHSRHFDFETCETKGLKVKRLEDDQKLQDAILTLHHAYMQTFSNTTAAKIVENQNGQSMIFNQRIA